MGVHEPDAPSVGEELHLPRPSLVPILNAAGVALALVGLTIWNGLVVIGLLLFAFTLVRWIKITENSLDYSLQNTARQALFLVTSRAEKYVGWPMLVVLTLDA